MASGASVPAHADDEPTAPEVVTDPIDVRGERARGEGPRDLVGPDSEHEAADRALDEPAFATVVRIDARAGETASVGEVLAETLGVHVRTLGGLGGFSSISVRGHAPGHTQVLVDGVPLSRVATVTADLGRFDLGSFSRLELYRGGVPVSLGGAAMGGALDLVTEVGRRPDGTRLRAELGAGSFGARHLRARWTDGRPDGSLGYHVGLGYAGSEGDFEYFNDNGTNLNQSDDAFVDRTNNGYDQADVVLRARHRRGAGTLEVGARTSARDQGIPGSASVQSERTSLRSVSQLVDASYRRRRLGGQRGLVGIASGYAVAEHQRYRDPDGEVGLGTQDRRYRTLSGGTRGELRLAIGERHLASAAIDLSADYYDDLDRLAEMTRTSGLRLGVGLAISDDWSLDARDRLLVQPAVRLDVLYTDPIDDTTSSVVGPMDVEPRTEVHPSPRVAARARLATGLVAKGSAGWYYRAPTLIETFGDRGFVVGNPGLVAETGMSSDVGLVLAPPGSEGPLDRVYVEVAGFFARSRDTIVQVPTAGLATVALNLGDALIGGGEVGASARLFETVTASANYTFIESRQSNTRPSYEGKRLPQRPRHELHVRLDAAQELAGRLGVVFGDASIVSGNHLDPANLRRVPLRLLLGAGLKVEPVPGLLVGVEGKNLTDTRIETVDLSPPPRPDLTESPRAVSDFFGYPLPGRAFYATAEWSY